MVFGGMKSLLSRIQCVVEVTLLVRLMQLHVIKDVFINAEVFKFQMSGFFSTSKTRSFGASNTDVVKVSIHRA